MHVSVVYISIWQGLTLGLTEHDLPYQCVCLKGCLTSTGVCTQDTHSHTSQVAGVHCSSLHQWVGAEALPRVRWQTQRLAVLGAEGQGAAGA